MKIEELYQYSIFDYPIYKVTKPIKLIETFAGIGAQAKALDRLGVPFIRHKVIDYDKFAVASYNAIHGTAFVPTDITQVHASDLEITDKEHFTYMLTYSFPCTDLSVAGAMKGASYEDWKNGNSTRSGLLWEVMRILEECIGYNGQLPDLLQMENVPQVHGKANLAEFERWTKFLESIGYTSYWQDMNAKEYGIAQSRNRTIMISVLGEYRYEFPQPIPLEKKMLDYLEDEVDDKYYLYSDKARQLIEKLIADGQIPLPERERERERAGVDLDLDRPEQRNIANCIQARYDKGISEQHQQSIGVAEVIRWGVGEEDGRCIDDTGTRL